MENIITLIAAILAFVASVATIIITVLNEQRRVKTDSITKNRIIWIKEVRNLTKKFLEIYIENYAHCKKRKKKLMIISSKINLYFRKGVNSYVFFSEALNRCVYNDYNDEDLKLLIDSAQIVFSDVWIRVKREAGIAKKEDKLYDELFGNDKS